MRALSVALAVSALLPQASKARRAHDVRESRVSGVEAPYVQMYREERWRNTWAQLSHAVRLSDVVEIVISRTSDTDQIIVTLIDVDGKRATLWTNGVTEDIDHNSMPVSSITDY